MAEATPALLLTLSAELRAELFLLDHTVDEAALAQPTGAGDALDRMRLYAGAALLDTFYTGVERLLERVARTFDAVPTGPHWHSDLLTASALVVVGVRPAVLSDATRADLKRYLAFRHQFRNLYLFDLERDQMAPLLSGLAPTWALARRDLEGFADQLDALASAVQAPARASRRRLSESSFRATGGRPPTPPTPPGRRPAAPPSRAGTAPGPAPR